MSNILLRTDSYKHSHFLQDPKGTEAKYYYIESRGGRYDEVVMFGLQYIIDEYLSKPFTQEDIEEAAEFCELHGEPFNRAGFEYILKQYGGLFPIEINALPEGTIAPVKVPLVTVACYDPKAAFCVGFLEPLLLQVWYPTTVATNSREIKKVIKKYLELTGTPESIDFKLHDFGYRGVSSNESAMIGGMAHLVNFKGTDTMLALVGARKYYGEKMAGFSIPAAEHSTITSWLRENEADAYRNMVNQFSKPGSLFAVVSDSYDLRNAVSEIWGNQLKDLVVESEGILVVRPDSGDPVAMPVWTVQALADKFGYTVNDKGYKVLNNVRVIQGDGVDIDSITKILWSLENLGFSADNIAFGMGGALLQIVNRDDQKFAMKCSAIKVNGVWRDVFKDPITDPGKQSKKGRVDTKITPEGKLIAGIVGWSDKTFDGFRSAMENVFYVNKSGYFSVKQKFSEIRERAKV